MTLTDFLLARIAEDEKAARIGLSIDDPLPNTYGVWEHERVLAECEARRRIVDEVRSAEVVASDAESTLGDCFVYEFAYGVLSLLALPYADHPDYCDEWKP